MSATAFGPLIAVDGGGTGCRAAVGSLTEGILAQARGGPANVSTNFDRAIANITATVQEAAQAAGLSPAQLEQATAHLGLAGADLEEAQTRTAQALPYGATRVSGDRQTTVAGVLGPRNGYVVALGTGTIIARQHTGTIKTVSGWGFQLSDTASGAWLGRNLLAQVLDAEEGLEPQTPLSRAVATRLGGVQGVFEFSNTSAPADYATFAPEIFAAGTAQDPLALRLLREGAAYVEKGLNALGFAQGDVLCLAGGVGPHYAPYLPEAFTANIAASKGNALEGAFALAGQFATSSHP